MYEVITEEPVFIPELGLTLFQGQRFQDGDVEPDWIADWLSRNIIRDLNAPVVVKPTGRRPGSGGITE